MTAKKTIIYHINHMSEPELGFHPGVFTKDQPNLDFKWFDPPHETFYFYGIEKMENLGPVDVTCEWPLWCRLIFLIGALITGKVRTRQMLPEIGLLSIQSFILFLLLFIIIIIREMDGIRMKQAKKAGFFNT